MDWFLLTVINIDKNENYEDQKDRAVQNCW